MMSNKIFLNLLKTVPVVALAAAIVSGILYRRTLAEIFLTLTITFGTITYHFVMRLLVGFIYHSVMHNRADDRKRRYQVGKYEKRLYEKLRVKKWKKLMPTYQADVFDPRQHTWEQIVQATCQAELVHETIAVLSFLPIIAGIWLGGYPAFIITSVLAALFDMMFVAIQRYNRQRIKTVIRKEYAGK